MPPTMIASRDAYAMAWKKIEFLSRHWNTNDVCVGWQKWGRPGGEELLLHLQVDLTYSHQSSTLVQLLVLKCFHMLRVHILGSGNTMMATGMQWLARRYFALDRTHQDHPWR